MTKQTPNAGFSASESDATTRAYWVEALLRIAEPVFSAMTEGRLRARMPVESGGDSTERSNYAHLEAVGRSLAGIGPWLNLSGGNTDEAEKRDRLRRQVMEALKRAVDPADTDRLNFAEGRQSLVDAAFLAQGLLRSWDQVWLTLDASTRDRIIQALRSTRDHKPSFKNWLLFSAMIEAFLCKAGAGWDPMRVDYAVRQHEQWYMGDGAYGDGPEFHWDYYNGFVIQPMLHDVLHADERITEMWRPFLDPVAARLRRYAAVQERLISPEGAFPPIGRSLAYRFGAFQALAQAALLESLPEEVTPAATRCAMTAVIRRMLTPTSTFDDNGWLRVGFCGHQPSIGEPYISTGSLYLCLCGLLPLGLPETAQFWADPDADWTAKRIWNGEDAPRDHALRG